MGHGMRTGEAVTLLYAEEFGRVPPAPRTAEPPPGPVDVEAACARAVDAARQDWTRTDAARRTQALETLAGGLASARDEAAAQAEAVAEAVARTALSAVAAALPHMARLHGDAEVRALLASLLPTLTLAAPVIVRVHPALAEALRGDIAALGEDAGVTVELRPANLPQGDVRLSWPDGSLTRDAQAIVAAVTEAMARLGLLDPERAPERAPEPARSLAYAE